MREIQIGANPDTVFSYLTDPAKLVQWMGREASLDVTPGGSFRLVYDDENTARGECLVVDPPRKVGQSWGWETPGAATPLGASRVEITLTAVAGGTLLRLVHSGLSEDEARSHAEGWDHFLPRLAMATDPVAA